METENNIELMKRLNSSSMYLQSNDMKVTEVREGYAKVEMIIDEQILNVHALYMVGLYFHWLIPSPEPPALPVEETA